MSCTVKRSHLRLGLLGLCLLLSLALSACQKTNPLLGKWLTPPPSNMLFEYRADGTVHLIESDVVRQVFRYKFTSSDSIMLVDGMGRIRYYRFEVGEDSLVFYDAETNEVALRMTRVE